MAKIVRLTEQDLVRLVNRVIKEQNSGNKSSTYTKGDYEKEHSKENWLKKAKNLFKQRGYKLISNSPFLMKKDNREVRYENLLGNDMFSLNISNYPAFDNTQINLKNYSPQGPFKVKYYKRGKVGETQVNEVEMNGWEVWQLLEKFQ
jgi:hypothetical protein